MWVNEFSMEAKTSAEKIWKIWTDVENWKDWVGSIEKCCKRFACFSKKID